MFHHRLSTLIGDPDYIKPGIPIMQPVPAEKKERRLDHSLLLAPADRLERRAEAFIRAGLYFNENDDAAIQNNQIQLPDGTAVIPLDKAVALFPEIGLGNALPFLPQNLLSCLHAYPIHSRTGLKLLRWIGDGP